MDQPATPRIVNPLSEPTSPAKSSLGLFLGVFLILCAGIATGFFLSKRATHSSISASNNPTPKTIKTANEVGVTDNKTFSDQATGTLEKGGIGSEGTHHLVRTGGTSQTVYLVSSVIDLDQYVGKQVEVAGQTLKAQKAAWLMDVGRLKVLN